MSSLQDTSTGAPLVHLHTILIANRGEVALRVAATARERGLRVVMVFTALDRGALHCRGGDLALLVPDYLDGPSLVQAALSLVGDGQPQRVAVHPGYGFLSERADFAAQVVAAGLCWLGPPAQAIKAMGDKVAARALAASLGVPVARGTDDAGLDDASLMVEAALLDFPVMVKAAAGGGGKGMSVVQRSDQLAPALTTARRLARAAFGDDRLLVERYIESARHVEVQIVADQHGGCLHLFERECSLQRRHQKVIEEAPSAALTPEQRHALCTDAVRVARAVDYRGVGTVEFLLAPDGRYYFLEMNTRLQVEHAVTELVTGLDLVGLQISLAEGARLPADQAAVSVSGWAIEARIYTEDATAGWLPSGGTVQAWWAPPGVRVDSAVGTGSVIGTYYDPLIAKVIAHGQDREDARRRLVSALRRMVLLGPVNTRGALVALLEDPRFVAADLSTTMLDDWQYVPPTAAWSVLCAVVAQHLLSVAQSKQQTSAALPQLSAAWRNNRWRDPELVLETAGQAQAIRWRQVGPGHYQLYRAPEAELVPVEPTELTEVRARLLPGGIEAEIDGVLEAFAMVHDQQQVRVQRPDGDVVVRVLPRFVLPGSGSDLAAGQGNAVVAPLTGTVVRVEVEPGADVTAGQTLIVIEAMKMEQAIKASRDGVVAEVKVVAQQQVERDSILVLLQPRQSEGASDEG